MGFTKVTSTSTGNLPVIEYFDGSLPEWWYEEKDDCIYMMPSIATEYGHLHVLKYYYNVYNNSDLWQYYEDCMDIASENNHFK